MGSLALGWVPVLLLFLTALTILSSVLWLVSTVPCVWAVTCSFWFLPEEYSTCLFWEKTSPKCRIQRFLVRQWTHVTDQSTVALFGFPVSPRGCSVPAFDSRPALRGETLARAPCTRQSPVRCLPRRVQDLFFFGVALVSTTAVVFSGLVLGRLRCIFAEFPLVVGRTGMLGILVGMDQKDRYAARCSYAVVHTPVVCNDRCATTGAMGHGVQKTAEFPQLQSIQVVDIPVVVQRPIPMVLVTMEVPQSRVDTVVDGPLLQVAVVTPRLVPWSRLAVGPERDSPVLFRQEVPSCCAGRAGRRHPGRGAEADSHGLACSQDQKDSAVQYFSWWSMPLLCRSFLLCPLLLRQARMVQTLQKFVEVPQSQFLSCCGRRCHYAATSCLATVKVPLIQFIAGVGGRFFS